MSSFSLPLHTSIDDNILQGLNGPIKLVIMLIGIYYFFIFSPLNYLFQTLNTNSLWHTFLWLALLLFLNNIADVIYQTIDWIFRSRGFTFLKGLHEIIIAVFRIIITLICIFAIANEWQQDLTGILAGLGIGGIAVAIAAQDTLANMYGGISIFIDKPFIKDQFVSISGVEGRVEEISLRSTRIRTFDRLLVSIPNSILAKEAITNFSKSNVRRIKFKLHLSYDTTENQLNNFIDKTKKYLSGLAEKKVLLKSGQNVTFDEYGRSSLEVLVICYAFFRFKIKDNSKKNKKKTSKEITGKENTDNNTNNNIKKENIENPNENKITNEMKIIKEAISKHLKNITTIIEKKIDKFRKKKKELPKENEVDPFEQGLKLIDSDSHYFDKNKYDSNEYVVAYYEGLKLRNEINMQILKYLREEKIKIVSQNIIITSEDNN